MQTSYDPEWVLLMLIARELGISKEEVEAFINRHKDEKKNPEKTRT
ncbi:anti-repressor SinI family protein [Tuberibacillus calidus]|nr:anti-repressor SinI family protein [Tuberibacillus calidus]